MSSIHLEPVQWANLPHIDDVEPICEKDRHILEEIREVLKKHNYTNRFGICLLHRHFDLAEDECLMEYTDVEERTSTLVVEKTSESQTKIETMWRFSDTVLSDTVCRVFCEYAGGHSRVHRQVGV